MAMAMVVMIPSFFAVKVPCVLAIKSNNQYSLAPKQAGECVSNTSKCQQWGFVQVRYVARKSPPPSESHFHHTVVYHTRKFAFHRSQQQEESVQPRKTKVLRALVPRGIGAPGGDGGRLHAASAIQPRPPIGRLA
ncbi:hypothetical protein B0T20DRAFT_110839 [Sordaria brevicollis]|uniref:Secreted protein n=1 Tax=Sordaria brevicollis TaxID=83679 RepID=A0AAE0U2H6_SORBR|nr:hypothetical protein B0T20DRAFT_110839 [Sordaria brevicollis]